MRSLCDKLWRIIGDHPRTAGKGYVMESDKRDSGLDEFDHVSAWILRLAVGMVVLGAVFAVLDRFDLLPLPAAAVVAGLS
jgi:hypothetical protein